MFNIKNGKRYLCITVFLAGIRYELAALVISVLAHVEVVSLYGSMINP